ncbi:MAG: molybdenum cofactor biosynthesis protein MoaE [Chloroflexi bacterium]|nr:molybdenum cofactor biosynthesis protein MoaE [Chloroflexota bacterium]
MTTPMTFTLKVKLFATLKDLAGSNELILQLDEGATIDTVREYVIHQVPALKNALPSAIPAVNHEYVFAGHAIQSGDEVAFFPPVSGGSDQANWPEMTLLAENPIDLNELTAQIVTPATGAIALFSGYVRGETKTGNGVAATTRLEYEAYAPMAVAKMQQVITEIRQQWPLVQGIAVVQRVGHLEVGQPTVLIACGAGHRDQGCFEAARYGIDRLKEIVPVWKKEIRPEGDAWVEGKYQPKPEDTIKS